LLIPIIWLNYGVSFLMRRIFSALTVKIINV
jgi:hypothetical protein